MCLIQSIYILYFLCILVIIISLYHFNRYNKCITNYNEMKEILSNNIETNERLQHEINNNNNVVKYESNKQKQKSHNNNIKLTCYKDLNMNANKLLLSMQNKIEMHKQQNNMIDNKTKQFLEL